VISVTALVLGLGGVLVAGGSWSIAVAVGWDAAALVYLGSVWWVALPMSPAETRRAARQEDSSRAAADTIQICASAASLVSVGFVLVAAARHTGFEKGGFIALAVATVGLAWSSIHTVYGLRYACLYYSDPVGGISFHADDPPDYRDFAYVAITIGLTFQVSDTDLTVRSIRRAAARHALLSYLFGAVIIAIMINLVGNLAH
jgi:uncharacterized membrane protein